MSTNTSEKPVSPAQDGNEGCTIRVTNSTGYQMTLLSSSTPHGEFTKGPPESIAKNGTHVVMAKGIDGTATGCQIKFCYQIADADITQVTWKYEKPYDGENSFSVTSSGKMSGNYTVDENPNYTPSSSDWLAIVTTVTKNS